jgi:hypothetical protein
MNALKHRFMKMSLLGGFAVVLAIVHPIWQSDAADAAAGIKTRPVKVIVVDEVGLPMPEVKIHRAIWTNVKFPPNADFITDNNGEVTFEAPEQVDILRLWASKKDYVPMFANFDARSMKGDPVLEKYTFTLELGTQIGGFVRDMSGAPIAGAKVEVCVDSRESAGVGLAVVNRWLAEGEDCCITDKHGFWTLGNVPPGDLWKIGLWLRHKDHVDDLDWRWPHKGASYTLAKLREQKAEVVMDSGVKVTGSITGPDGKPASNALIIWGDNPYHNSNQQEVWADDKGRYELPPLSAGPTMLTIVAEGFAPELKVIDLIGPKQGENIQLHTGKTITIHFVDTAGKPVPQVIVNIAGWRRKHRSSIIDIPTFRTAKFLIGRMIRAFIRGPGLLKMQLISTFGKRDSSRAMLFRLAPVRTPSHCTKNGRNRIDPSPRPRHTLPEEVQLTRQHAHHLRGRGLEHAAFGFLDDALHGVKRGHARSVEMNGIHMRRSTSGKAVLCWRMAQLCCSRSVLNVVILSFEGAPLDCDSRCNSTMRPAAKPASVRQ